MRSCLVLPIFERLSRHFNSIMLYSMLNVQILCIKHTGNVPQISFHTLMHSCILPEPPQDQYTTPRLTYIIASSSPNILGCRGSTLAQCYCSSAVTIAGYCRLTYVTTVSDRFDRKASGCDYHCMAHCFHWWWDREGET